MNLTPQSLEIATALTSEARGDLYQRLALVPTLNSFSPVILSSGELGPERARSQAGRYETSFVRSGVEVVVGGGGKV
jgi:hypothetical protein